MNTQSDPKTVIFDGECPVCTNLKAFTENRLEDGELTFIAFQEKVFEQAAPHLSREEANRTIFVIGRNGKRFQGAKAVFEIMSALPGGWGFIGKVFRLPPIYWIAEPFYRLFANRRYVLSRFLRD